MSWKKPYNENQHEEELPSVGDDGEIEEEKPKAKSNCYEVYTLFEALLGKYPLNWRVNKTQRLSAENLYTERGIKTISNALEFYKEHKEKEYCPQISSPYDLDSKWTKLAELKRKYGN